jgi:TPR repeat protein
LLDARGRARLSDLTVRVQLARVALVVGFVASRVGHADAPPGALAGAERQLAQRFASQGVAYPPRAVTLVALKSEARLELWADGGAGWRFVRSYLIRASSGRLGPKLRQGDHQVPEGVYRIAALNPASRFHLSLRVDYPNAFDRARALEDGRERLGGDIMIHGGAASDGCVPIGDAAIEEVFALVDRVGVENVGVILSPLDLRRAEPRRAQAKAAERTAWLPELYANIARALEPFSLPVDDPVRPGRVREAKAACKPYDAADCARRCSAHDLASCARAGLMYEGELGIAADRGRAWALLRQACNGGDAFGCAELARLYLSDDGPRRDAVRAAELAETACDGGDGHGCSYLARLCADRITYPATLDGCSPSRVTALRRAAVARLRSGCRGCDAHDCSTLASIYYPGSAADALRFAAGACEGGEPDGCYTLARLSEDGGDLAGAATLYARACRRGHAEACERAPEATPRTILASP